VFWTKNTFMNSLTEHYRLLLDLDAAWTVSDVSLSLEEKCVEIRVTHGGGRVTCPDCDRECTIADHAPERTWRHLDTMQFETRIVARTPRADCETCGVKTIAVPWASKHSRFTLMFEAFAIEVLLACGSIKSAIALLGISWSSGQQIMDRAVQRGLARRDTEKIERVGMDEKSFRRGHNYVTVLTDLDGSRVLEVAEGRDEKAANEAWTAISEQQRDKVKAVAIDMWTAFETAARKHVPQADIVHDRFHISKHLNEAVDKVRRTEHKALKQEGDQTLAGSKHSWLFNPENMKEDRWLEFQSLKDLELKTSRAWAIKEQFRWFWDYTYAGNAEKFFKQWYGWAARSRLTPIIDAARMIKSHLPNVLTYFRHRITNAISEGFNSRIQSIKASARGFRAFENYRTRILFHCGKLDLKPDATH
jgi:transposase